MQQMLGEAPVHPAWTRVAQLVNAIRRLSRYETKIAQVVCGALHGSIEGTEDWYSAAVQLQRCAPALLNICKQTGFWDTAVPVLVHERRGPVTFYVMGPRATGEGGCEDCSFQTL